MFSRSVILSERSESKDLRIYDMHSTLVVRRFFDFGLAAFAQNDMELVRWLSQGRMITSAPDPSSVKNQRFLPASPEGEAFGTRILRCAQNDMESVR